MFGQLRISSCSLTSEQKEAYHADFCSLCHSLKSQEGSLSTLLTNYDSTFWLSVASGLRRDLQPIVKKRCTAVPLRSVMVREHPFEVSRSNVSLLWLLVRAKAEDDVQDENSLKARVALRLSRDKATLAERYLQESGFDTACLTQLPERQRAAESTPAASFDQVAEPTARMMSEAFGHLARVCHRPDKRRSLREMGAALGTSIYLLDALDDYSDDLKAGRFNPAFRSTGSQTVPELANLAQRACQALEQQLDELELSQPSRGIVQGAVSKLRVRLLSHRLLEGALSSSCCATRRRGQAAFCRPGLDIDQEQPEGCCRRKCGQCTDCGDCCDGCEGCCECGECCSGCDGCGGCDCGGCDGCSGCDCGGCDCGGCSSLPDSLRRWGRRLAFWRASEQGEDGPL